MNILEEIIAHKKIEIEKSKEQLPFNKLKQLINSVGAGFTSAPSEGAEVNPAPTSEPQDENIPTSPSGEDPSQEGTDLIESLQVKLQFVNRFGREATRVPWWDVVAVHVQVVDQSGNAVTGAFVELRYRYAGTTADLGKPTALTDASGAADFKIGPFKMKSTIEAGVVASKDGVNSQLAMGTLSVR